MKYCGDAVATADAVVAANIAAGHSLTLMHRSFMSSLGFRIHWIHRVRYNVSEQIFFRFGNLMLVCCRMDGRTSAHDVLYLCMNSSDQQLMYRMSRMRRSPLSAKRLFGRIRRVPFYLCLSISSYNTEFLRPTSV